MISRLTASAVVFAVLATASLGYAAQTRQLSSNIAPGTDCATEIVMLPRIEVTGHRAR